MPPATLGVAARAVLIWMSPVIVCWRSCGDKIGESSIEFVVTGPDHWIPSPILSSSFVIVFWRLFLICVLPLPHSMFPYKFASTILRMLQHITNLIPVYPGTGDQANILMHPPLGFQVCVLGATYLLCIILNIPCAKLSGNIGWGRRRTQNRNKCQKTMVKGGMATSEAVPEW